MFKLFSRNTAITTKELENDLSEKTILDVRTPGEYRTGHISNAKNIPLDKIAAYAGPTETPVYVICQSGMRSKRAAGILKRKGYTAINVRGGMSQWTGTIKGGK
ncbi:rhodanese-like domain-containing protein [Jeotgalibaca porci]|uniref:rhodanese-like domain-containing protein n=1 Tax=Jeotgalibaca porci TaxID=1868793 RepID=UPI00359F19A9